MASIRTCDVLHRVGSVVLAALPELCDVAVACVVGGGLVAAIPPHRRRQVCVGGCWSLRGVAAAEAAVVNARRRRQYTRVLLHACGGRGGGCSATASQPAPHWPWLCTLPPPGCMPWPNEYVGLFCAGLVEPAAAEPVSSPARSERQTRPAERTGRARQLAVCHARRPPVAAHSEFVRVKPPACCKEQ